MGLYLKNFLDEHERLHLYDIDCEYSRNFEHPKSMIKKFLEKIEEIYTYPDLIIYKRKSNDYNLVIFEFKKGKIDKEKRNKDFDKLKYFTNLNNEYKYKYGFYIELHRNFADVHIFINGKEMANMNYKI